MPYYTREPKQRPRYVTPWYQRPPVIWSIVAAIAAMGVAALAAYIFWPRTSSDILAQVGKAKEEAKGERGPAWTWDTSSMDYIIEDQFFFPSKDSGGRPEYDYSFVVRAAKSLGLHVFVIDFYSGSRIVGQEQQTIMVEEGRNVVKGQVKLKEGADRFSVRR
jgi:hypothetical protein